MESQVSFSYLPCSSLVFTFQIFKITYVYVYCICIYIHKTIESYGIIVDCNIMSKYFYYHPFSRDYVKIPKYVLVALKDLNLQNKNGAILLTF